MPTIKEIQHVRTKVFENCHKLCQSLTFSDHFLSRFNTRCPNQIKGSSNLEIAVRTIVKVRMREKVVETLKTKPYRVIVSLDRDTYVFELKKNRTDVVSYYIESKPENREADLVLTY